MTAAPESTGRTPGGDQRLEVILTVAERMFYEKGYRGVSIRDLAEAVGIKMSSLYYYFPSKDEILYRVIKRHLDVLHGVTDKALASLPPGATVLEKAQVLIRSSVLALIADRLAAEISVSQTRELGQAQQDELNGMVKLFESRVLAVVEEGIASGEFISTDARIASYAILGALVRLSVRFRPVGRLSPDEIADLYCVLLVRGLLADPSAVDAAVPRRPLAAP